MAEVRWTLQAAVDIESICDFIAKDSPHYARLFAVKVFEAIEHLIKFLQSGRVVPEINNTAVRELILGSYRIVYRYKKDLVELLTIHHSSRPLNSTRLL